MLPLCYFHFWLFFCWLIKYSILNIYLLVRYFLRSTKSRQFMIISNILNFSFCRHIVRKGMSSRLSTDYTHFGPEADGVPNHFKIYKFFLQKVRSLTLVATSRIPFQNFPKAVTIPSNFYTHTVVQKKVQRSYSWLNFNIRKKACQYMCAREKHIIGEVTLNNFCFCIKLLVFYCCCRSTEAQDALKKAPK